MPTDTSVTVRRRAFFVDVEDGRVVEVLDSYAPCDRHLFQDVIDVP